MDGTLWAININKQWEKIISLNYYSGQCMRENGGLGKLRPKKGFQERLNVLPNTKEMIIRMPQFTIY